MSQVYVAELSTRPRSIPSAAIRQAAAEPSVAGDLSDSRTLYVIDLEEKRVGWPPPYRIVYRLVPSERDPAKLQVIWAGPRDDGAVYRTAARRLGRR